MMSDDVMRMTISNSFCLFEKFRANHKIQHDYHAKNRFVIRVYIDVPVTESSCFFSVLIKLKDDQYILTELNSNQHRSRTNKQRIEQIIDTTHK